ncbi:MAG: hypothetical protein V1843_02635 [bacterium]
MKRSTRILLLSTLLILVVILVVPEFFKEQIIDMFVDNYLDYSREHVIVNCLMYGSMTKEGFATYSKEFYELAYKYYASEVRVVDFIKKLRAYDKHLKNYISDWHLSMNARMQKPMIMSYEEAQSYYIPFEIYQKRIMLDVYNSLIWKPAVYYLIEMQLLNQQYDYIKEHGGK